MAKGTSQASVERFPTSWVRHKKIPLSEITRSPDCSRSRLAEKSSRQETDNTRTDSGNGFVEA